MDKLANFQKSALVALLFTVRGYCHASQVTQIKKDDIVMSSSPSSLVMATASAITASTLTDSVEETNWKLSRSMVWVWVVLVGAVIIWAGALRISKHIRVVVAHPTNNQHYFSLPNYHYSLIRKHFWDAPMFKRRHHREFQLSKAVNMGTLPSRSQGIFLIGYLIMATTLTVYDLPWSGPMKTVLSDVVQRTGYMAIMNMLPLFLLSSRNNPLITWTGISFDTYNLIHRWLGRIVVLESVIHAGSWIIKEVKYLGGWSAVGTAFTNSTFYMSGLIVS
jgi:hypothetical protein